MPAASAVSGQSLTLDTEQIIPATDLAFGVNDESFSPATDRHLIIVGDRNTCAPDIAQHLVSEALTQRYRTIIIPSQGTDGRFDFAAAHVETLVPGTLDFQVELLALASAAVEPPLTQPVLLVVEDLQELTRDLAGIPGQAIELINYLMQAGPEVGIHLVVNAGETLDQPYRLALANTVLGRNINKSSVVIAGIMRDHSDPELWWGSRVLDTAPSDNPNDAVMVTQKPGSVQLQVPDFA